MVIQLDIHPLKFTASVPNGTADNQVAGLELLRDLADYMSYNDSWRKFKYLFQAQYGREPDLSIEGDLVEFTYDVPPFYQNYLWQEFYKEKGRTGWVDIGGKRKRECNHNPITGEWFSNRETWDGYKSVVSINERLLSTTPILNGYLRDTIIFLTEEGAEVEIVDHRETNPGMMLTPDPVYEFGNVSLRQGQRDALDKVRTTIQDTDRFGHLFGNILMDLAMNFGKSYLLPMMVKNFNTDFISVHNSSLLFNKAVAEFLEFGFEIHVYSASYTSLNKYLKGRGIAPNYKKGFGPFTVAMLQTMHKRLETGRLESHELSRFGGAILDEIDLLASPTLVEVFEHMRVITYITASGTPFDSWDGGKRSIVYGFGGSIRHTVTYEQMRETGNSLDIRYILSTNDIPDSYAINHSPKDLKDNQIVRSKRVLERLADILRIEEGNSTCVYFGHLEIKYIHYVADYLEAQGFSVIATDGGDPERDAKLRSYETGASNVLLINRIAGIGWSVPRMQALVNFDPSGDISKIKQVFGRVIRTSDLMDHGRFYDWMHDDSALYFENSLIRKAVLTGEGMGLTAETWEEYADSLKLSL